MEWLKTRIRTRFKGYRTVVINTVLAVMPFLEMSELLDIIPNEYLALYALCLALLNMGLRKVTTTPMGKSL
jgi:hypothetical protein